MKTALATLECENWEWVIPEELVHEPENAEGGFSCLSKDESKKLFVSIYSKTDAESMSERCVRMEEIIERATREALKSDMISFGALQSELDGLIFSDIGGFSPVANFGIFSRIVVTPDYSYRVSIHDYWSASLPEFQAFSRSLIEKFKIKK